ncbi:hypothetical protein UT300019_24100 [Clostridium sp. CTA-19]
MNDENDEKDMLVAWTEFLKDPESEKVRNLEMTVKEIREAKDSLIRMSNDKKQRELYEMREKILKDRVSALNTAKTQGENEKALEIIKNSLNQGLSIDIISKITGKTIEEINEIKDLI